MMCFGLKDRKRLKTNHCVIVLLDDTQLVHELHPSSTGQDLLDVVIKHLNLLETSYFGLKYYPDGGSASQYDLAATGGGQFAYVAPSNQTNSRRQLHNHHQPPVWLDMERSAIKQLRDANPMTVHFGVKYYATDPCKLAEEITRYQFFLQCKQDILSGRLPVSYELAVELFALAIQSELGDYDPNRHLENYASEFQFVPNQTLELEQRAALYHRQLIGQVPATAELNFLEKVKWLDLYGCQLHLIQYDDGDARSADLYALGLNPSGVLVLRNRLKVAQYLWSRIVKTKCQGRCFLMDVIDANPAAGAAAADQHQLNSGGLLTTIGGHHLHHSHHHHQQRPNQAKRNRFGFRLADKNASRRLRWAIEEHKHFYHLIHSTTSYNQLARHQRQQQQHHQQQQQQQVQQHCLRSGGSIKSLNHNLVRPPPQVVRTPSRRYSNRSLPRPSMANGGVGGQQQQQQQQYGPNGRLVAAAQANGNGLPPVVGMSSTLMPSHRQQAMLMMASQQQQHQHQFSGLQTHQPSHNQHYLNKSHTLKPISSKEAKQRGYYQMMLAGGQAAAGPGNRRPCGLAEVAFLPPGQHNVQPSIYRATSVVDGINQLDIKQQQSQFRPTMMQQFFNTRAQRTFSGHESPRSTKSAMAPSSALKLASKKLAKQQQQLLYGNQASDVRPLLGYAEPNANGGGQLDLYYSNMTGCGGYYSAGQAYGAASAALVRSKSTGENLHLVHKHQQQAAAIRANNKMLLATASGGLPLVRPAHVLPPPDYNSSSETPRANQLDAASHNRRHNRLSLSGNRKAVNGPTGTGGAGGNAARRRNSHDDDDDDYYCSRSDCSSIDDGNFGSGKARQARFINGRLVNVAPGQQQQQQQVVKSQEQQAGIRSSRAGSEWLADSNNNNLQVAPKNIANKQATPILLSMSNHFDPLQPAADHTKANSKAVALLNMQRQHLQTNGSGAGSVQPLDRPNMSARTTAPRSSGSDSAGSSAASSPQLPQSNAANAQGQQQQQQPQLTAINHRSFSQRRHHHNVADSTGSSSTTTSGYYAGSNSTEPASVDSDTVSAECAPIPAEHQNDPPAPLATSESNQNHHHHHQMAPATGAREGTRAKIALGVHGPSARRLADAKSGNYVGQAQPGRKQQPKEQHFYLGDRSSMSFDGHNQSQQARQASESGGRGHAQTMHQQQQQQWAQLEQLQQGNGPGSLKYVSFDV